MDEKYVVVKNNKPQTGPLSLKTAERVADEIGNGAKVEPVEPIQNKSNPYNFLLTIIFAIATGITLAFGAVTNDWGRAVVVGGFTLFGMMIFGAWAIITNLRK